MELETYWIKRVELALCAIGFAIFAFLLLIATGKDWDVFETSALIERSIWLLEFKPPIWTYSLCGGASLVANPQSIGISPSILPILLFGAVIGWKVLILLFLMLGVYGIKLLLEKIIDPAHQWLAWALGIIFVTGEYFTSHLLVGHASFGFMYLVPIFCAFQIRLIVNGVRFNKELILFLLIAWLTLSGSFYHAGVFFLMTTQIALCVSALLQKNRAILLGRCIVTGLLALVTSAYRIVPALLHQQKYPRDFGDTFDNAHSFTNLILFQLFPSRNKSLFFGEEFATRANSWWEYASFTPLLWVLIVLCLTILITRVPTRNTPSPAAVEKKFIITWASALVIISSLLYLGSFYSLSPFSIINHYIFSDSLRISTRFIVGAQLGYLILIGWLASRHIRLTTVLITISLVIICYENFRITGSMIDRGMIRKTLKKLSLPWTTPKEFNRGVIVAVRWATPMYNDLVAGDVVINCYDSINDESTLIPLITKTLDNKKFKPNHKIYTPIVIENSPGDSKCKNDSFFTHSTINVSPSCAPGSQVVIRSLGDTQVERVVKSDGIYVVSKGN